MNARHQKMHAFPSRYILKGIKACTIKQGGKSQNIKTMAHFKNIYDIEAIQKTRIVWGLKKTKTSMSDVLYDMIPIGSACMHSPRAKYDAYVDVTSIIGVKDLINLHFINL